MDSPTASMASFIDEDLKRRPITWSIATSTSAGIFHDNVQITSRLGIDLKPLPCKHFPQVSLPGKLADYIRAATLKSR